MAVPGGGGNVVGSAEVILLLNPEQFNRSLQQSRLAAEQAGSGMSGALTGGLKDAEQAANRTAESFNKTAQAAKQIAEAGRVRVKFDVDTKNIDAAVTQIQQRLRTLKQGDESLIRVRGSDEQFQEVMRRVNASLAAARRRGAEIEIGQFRPATGGSPGRPTGPFGGAFGDVSLGRFSAIAAGASALGGVGVAGAQALNEALTSTVQITQDAAQAQFALRRIFQENAEVFKRAASEIAEEQKRSNVEVQQAVVITGSLSKNYGLTAEQLQKLVKVSGDLAAVQGTEIVDSTKRVEAAIRGEAESAERLGLTLNATFVRATARMTEEQRKNFETLRQSERAQINYNELLRQSAFAQGAAAERAASSAGAFDRLGASMANFAESIGSRFLPVIAAVARALADLIDQANKASQIKLPGGGGPPVLEAAGNIASMATPFGIVAKTNELALGTAANAIRAQEESRAERVAEQNREYNAQVKVIEGINSQISDILKQKEGIKKQQTEELEPLKEQLSILQRQNLEYERQTQQLNLRRAATEQMRQQALGDPGTRARLQGELFSVEREQEVLSIRQRAAEINRSIAEAEAQIQERAIERRIELEERALRAQQDAAREASEARRTALDDLRNETQAAQDARQNELQNIREINRQASDTRRQEIDDLRELGQEAQRARQDELEVLRLVADTARQRFQDEKEAADDAHRGVMQGYQERIDSLRDQLSETQRIGETEAEKALRVLEIRERQADIERGIRDAQLAVLTATDLRSAIQAVVRLQEAQREANVERQRLALQERIRRERESEERKRAEIQQRIAGLERRAREEDRRYQRERDVIEDRFRQEERTFREQQRVLEQQDRERRRAEEDAVRAKEQANRAADFAAQEALHQKEREFRAQEIADRERVQAAERSARQADFADQQAIVAEQRRIQDQRDTLADARFERETARLQQQLIDLKESSALELQRLGIQQQILDLQNTSLLKEATIRAALEQHQADTLASLKAIDGALKAIEAVDVIAQQQAIEDKFTNQRIQLDRQVELLRERSQLLQQAVPAQPPSETNPQPQDPGIVGAAGARIQEEEGFLRQLGSNIINGFINLFRGDSTAVQAITEWSQTGIATLQATWQTNSDSRITIALANDVINGFVNTLRGRAAEVTAAYVSMFPAEMPDVGLAIDAQFEGFAAKLIEDAENLLVDSEVIDAVNTALVSMFPPQVPEVGLAIDRQFDGFSQKILEAARLQLVTPLQINAVSIALTELFPPIQPMVGIAIDNMFVGFSAKLIEAASLRLVGPAQQAAVSTALATMFPAAVTQEIANSIIAFSNSTGVYLADALEAALMNNATRVRQAVWAPLDDAQFDSGMQTIGGNAAVSFINGFMERMAIDGRNMALAVYAQLGNIDTSRTGSSAATQTMNNVATSVAAQVPSNFGTFYGLQHGTPYVPRTGPALLHQGEAVIPALSNPFTNNTDGFRQLLNQEPAGGSSGAVNVTVNIDSAGGVSMEGSWSEYGQQMANAIIGGIRQAQLRAPYPARRIVPGAM